MKVRSPGANDRSMSSLPARTIKAGITYFALVFGAGFVLGSIRVPFLVPRLGERIAELIEMPSMFIVIVVASRFITKRFALPATVPVRLGAGLLALGWLIAAEILLAVALQDRSLGEYLSSRDPVSGSVYVAMLALFAAMPLVITRLRFGRSYGELLENAHSRGLIAHLADETLRVFASRSNHRPAENGVHNVEGTLIPVVIPRSAAHRSSMVQDLESGRRTEIDYLNGAIVRMGHEVGIDTPFRQSVVALIHARERV